MKSKIFKRISIAVAVMVILTVIFIVISYINQQLQLKREADQYKVIGKQVEVNGHLMNVYSEGSGEQTIVFMSGAGTCSPVLDFKSLYSCLSDQYKVVVVEKAGYGFSEDSDIARDIDTVLSETRQALSLAGIPAPYVLCPHSMSGIEALYWGQKYPEEVSAIIGLDMSVPEAYADMKINMPLLYLGEFAAKFGLTRWIASLADSDAIKYGTLTDQEKELYKVIFYRSTATGAMINEAKEIKASAEKVGSGQIVNGPILIFSSNGSGGTGYTQEKWRGFHQKFINSRPNGKIIELDCPHYVQDYEFERIADEIDRFLSEVN